MRDARRDPLERRDRYEGRKIGSPVDEISGSHVVLAIVHEQEDITESIAVGIAGRGEDVGELEVRPRLLAEHDSLLAEDADADLLGRVGVEGGL